MTDVRGDASQPPSQSSSGSGLAVTEVSRYSGPFRMSSNQTTKGRTLIAVIGDEVGAHYIRSLGRGQKGKDLILIRL